VPEFWGFDAIDIKGMISFWTPTLPLITAIGGKLNTAAFREKMLSYGCTEESYLDYRILYGTPQPPGELIPNAADMMPLAYGVIDSVNLEGEAVSMILMVSRESGKDVQKAKTHIETVLQAYHQKPISSYLGMVEMLASNLGTVGSALLVDFSILERMWQQKDQVQKEELQTTIGPGRLDPYINFSIAFKKEGGDSFLEFILAYNTAEKAEANVNTLQKHLTEGRSIMYKKPLSEVWTVDEVKTEHSLLRARVKLIPQEGGKPFFFTGWIYLPDYWFLFPN
jgi:hypothetical protein